jgi:adenylate cyclase
MYVRRGIALSTYMEPKVRPIERTVLFSDVVDSTGTLDRRGLDAWVGMIERHGRSIEAVARRHRGELANFTGDGYMVLLPDPAAAVECALRLRNAFDVRNELAVRIGLAHGTVVPFARGSVVGLAAHVAARLTATAQGGEVVMCERCYEAARRTIALPALELREVQVRGLDGVHRVRVVRQPERMRVP